MKDTKFRAKTIEDGDWVYGSLVINEYGPYILGDYNQNPLGMFLIDPKTIGQFIGLYAEDNTEVYEKDILQFTNEEADDTPWEVPYITPDNWGELESIMDCEFDMGNNRYSNIIVAGNVYDNPELLRE